MSEWIGALVGAVIGAVIGGVTSLLVLRFNYRHLFASVVSSNRMEWINVWRESLSEFLAIAEEMVNYPEGIDHEQGIKLKKAKNMVLMRLNKNEYAHDVIEDYINELCDNIGTFAQNKQYSAFESLRNKIMDCARLILKPEWERVKKEARGKESV